MRDLGDFRSVLERETRYRVLLTLYDHEYDELSYKVNLKINTLRPDLDGWWRQNFQPHTGLWIHSHPELDIVRSRYAQYIERKARRNN